MYCVYICFIDSEYVSESLSLLISRHLFFSSEIELVTLIYLIIFLSVLLRFRFIVLIVE